MNYAIIISFLIAVASSFLALFPDRVALLLVGTNKYDLDSVPRPVVTIIFVSSVLLLAISLFVLLQQSSLIDIDFPFLPDPPGMVDA